MPGLVLIYNIATRKHTNLSIKIIRGGILKGFAAWLLNEWFGSIGKQNQTHRALKKPEYLDQVRTVRAHIHSSKSEKWMEKVRECFCICATDVWLKILASASIAFFLLLQGSPAFPVRHSLFESIGHSAFAVIGCKRSLRRQKKFSKMQHNVLLSP